MLGPNEVNVFVFLCTMECVLRFFHVMSSCYWWRWGVWPEYRSIILLLNPSCPWSSHMREKIWIKSAHLGAVCMPRWMFWTARQRQNCSMISAQELILSSHLFTFFWPRQRHYLLIQSFWNGEVICKPRLEKLQDFASVLTLPSCKERGDISFFLGIELVSFWVKFSKPKWMTRTQFHGFGYCPISKAGY